VNIQDVVEVHDVDMSGGEAQSGATPPHKSRCLFGIATGGDEVDHDGGDE